MIPDFVAGDTAAKIRVQCYNRDGTVFTLAGRTIQIKFRIGNGAQVVASMTILSPASAGQAEYQFTTGQLVAGKMRVAVKVTIGAVVISSQDIGVFNVRADV
jgi:translation initiation factor IF-1